MATSLFGITTSINANVTGTLLPQSFVATAGQTLFILTALTYTQNTSSLIVFINGQRQVAGRDFTETSSSSFTLLEGAIAGDFIDVIGFPLITDAASAGTLRGNLISTLGATFVGWKSSAAGSVFRTLFSQLSDKVSVLDFGADPTGVANSAAAIQAAIDAGKRVYIPNGNYNIGTTGLLLNDSSVLDFESRAARIFGTVAGGMIAGKNNGTQRRFHAMIFSGTLDNTNKATAGGIGIDFKSMTMGKVFGTFITNVNIGVRNLGINPITGSYYNEFHGVDISTVVTGYDNGTLGNENKVFGGRVNDCTTGTRDNDCTGNLYVGCAIEVFTTGHLNSDTTAATNIKYMFSRLENVPTFGIGIDIRAPSQVCSYIAPQSTGLTTNVSDASAGKDAFGWSDDGLRLKGGSPIKGHQNVTVVKDLAALAAGTFRQEQFLVPGFAAGDSVSVTLPASWLNIVAGPCIDGGTGAVYLPLYNSTGASIDMPSASYQFTIWKH